MANSRRKRKAVYYVGEGKRRTGSRREPLPRIGTARMPRALGMPRMPRPSRRRQSPMRQEYAGVAPASRGGIVVVALRQVEAIGACW